MRHLKGEIHMPSWSCLRSFLDTARDALKAADERIKKYIAGNGIYHEQRAGILRAPFHNERYFQYLIAERMMSWPVYLELDVQPGQYDLVLFENQQRDRCLVAMEMKLIHFVHARDKREICQDIEKLKRCSLNPEHRYMIMFPQHLPANTPTFLRWLSTNVAPALGRDVVPNDNFHYASFLTRSAHPQAPPDELEFMVAAIEV
jgi:hypothetical protein